MNSEHSHHAPFVLSSSFSVRLCLGVLFFCRSFSQTECMVLHANESILHINISTFAPTTVSTYSCRVKMNKNMHIFRFFFPSNVYKYIVHTLVCTFDADDVRDSCVCVCVEIINSIFSSFLRFCAVTPLLIWPIKNSHIPLARATLREHHELVDARFSVNITNSLKLFFQSFQQKTIILRFPPY